MVPSIGGGEGAAPDTAIDLVVQVVEKLVLVVSVALGFQVFLDMALSRPVGFGSLVARKWNANGAFESET